MTFAPTDAILSDEVIDEVMRTYNPSSMAVWACEEVRRLRAKLAERDRLLARMCAFHEECVMTSRTIEAYTDIIREAFAAVGREYPADVEQTAKRNIAANAERDRATLARVALLEDLLRRCDGDGPWPEDEIRAALEGGPR